MRLPTFLVVQADGSTKAQPTRTAPVHAERFTGFLCQNSAALSDALTRFQDASNDVARAVQADPFAEATIIRGLTAGTFGTKLVVTHNLGRLAQWMVVGWRGIGTATVYQLVEDLLDTPPRTDLNTLALRSYTAGVVDLLVF